MTGNVWSRTLFAGRAERNEYLLLHEFHARKFIYPDKPKYGSKITSGDGVNDDDDDDGNRKKVMYGRRCMSRIRLLIFGVA